MNNGDVQMNDPSADALEARLEVLEMMMGLHIHDGNMSTRVNMSDLFGLFETVSTVPTISPLSIFDQVKLYSNAGTFKLYVFDATNNAWRFVTLT